MADLEQRTRDLAYRLWEEAGRPDGRDHEFWYAARQQVEAEPVHNGHVPTPVTATPAPAATKPAEATPPATSPAARTSAPAPAATASVAEPVAPPPAKATPPVKAAAAKTSKAPTKTAGKPTAKKKT
ncbi:conserved protein of unknown function [Rhodovastum atsumiense]|nr:DUF2934 domain-containing protein [Rhodovastum atsumiense]CAH2600138.1 conserved protein of unknown function [Rhodovastum atsumiense]